MVSKKKRWFRRLVWFSVGCILIVATIPWWIGFLIKLLAPVVGVGIDRLETHGWNEWILYNVSWKTENETLSLQAGQVNIPNPMFLLLRETGTVRVENWQAALKTPGHHETEEPEETESGGIPEDFQKLCRYWSLLERFKIEAYFLHGSADIEGISCTIPHFSVTSKILLFAGSLDLDAETSLPLQFSLSREQRDQFQLKAHSPDYPGKLELRLDSTPSNVSLQGAFFWDGEGIHLSAYWDSTDLLPVEFLAEATHFVIPQNAIHLEGYQPPAVRFQLRWLRPSYHLESSLRMLPLDSGLPPIHIHLQGKGDEDSFSLTHFTMEGPGLHSFLQSPLHIRFSEPTSWQKAVPLSLNIDFTDLPMAEIQGKLEGGLLFHPPADPQAISYPSVQFNLSGSGLQWKDFPAFAFTLDGNLQWPRLELAHASIRREGMLEVSARGEFLVDTLRIKKLDFDFDLNATLQALLFPHPEDIPVKWESIQGRSHLDGTWPDLSGELSLNINGLDVPGLVPTGPGTMALNLSGTITDHLQLHASMEHPALILQTEALLELSTDFSQYRAEVRQLDLSPAKVGGLRLQKPFTVEFDQQSQRLSLLDLHWEPTDDTTSAPTLKLDIRQLSPQTGDLSLFLKNLPTDWLQPWLEIAAETPDVRIDELTLQAHWDGESPLTGILDNRTSYQLDDQPRLSTHLKLRAENETLYLERISARQEELLLLEGEGRLPVAFYPKRFEKPWEIFTERPLHLDIHSSETFDSWALLDALTGVEIHSPSLAIRVNGTPDAPSGTLYVHAGKIRLMDGLFIREGIPEIDELTLSLHVTENGLRLNRADIDVAGNTLHAEAFLPMNKPEWQALWSAQELPDWSDAEGSFSLRKTELSTLREFIPPPLRPRGTLEFSARLQPGKQISGNLLLENVETFPILPLGTINNIQANLHFAGKSLEVIDLRADIGGRTVSIDGEIHLDEDWNPRFDLKLEGTQVPFVRSPGLILRGSPSIALQTDSQGITTLTGEVILNESFFMLDISALQSGGGSPETRPPYFSITEEPMARWRLHLAIRGDDFLRVRTPVFESMVSVDLQMRGSLREPFVFGQATLGRGVVLFPFAVFQVQEGGVALDQSDPYNPQIHLLATTRAYGYDLTMRASGTPSDPTILFSSTPSLDSSEILLMVTAGVLPNSGNTRSSGSRLGGLGVFIGNNILTELGLIDPLDDRLQIRVGEDVTDMGKDTIDVEFRIDDSWSIIGEYDRFDAYNLNLKWKIYSR